MKDFFKDILDGFKELNIPPWAFMVFTAVYNEILLFWWTCEQFTFMRFLCILIFALSFGAIMGMFCTFGRKVKAKRITAIVLSSVCGVIMLLEFFIFDAFKTFMSPSSIFSAAGDVAGDFMLVIFKLILRGLWRILLVALPIVAYGIICAKKKYKTFHRTLVRGILASCCVVFLLAGHFISLASPDGAKYKSEYDFNSAVQSFGLVSAFRLDATYSIFNNSSDTDFDHVPAATPEEVANVSSQPDSSQTPRIFGYNKMNIDFDALASQTKDSSLKSIHSYVSSIAPSKQNEYTGLFKGKNLIFITAEAFSAEAIDPVRTPTLYRLANKGIKFTDYYQPAWGGSTSTGEYSNIMGLVPTAGVKSIQKTIGHNMYFTMGNQLKRLGYTSYAYHNNSYTYYGRNKTHENLGYSKFMGIGNGMEAGVKNCWPQSDQEMMNFTVKEYIDKQPFNIYYMTVSGHCNYTQAGNSMSKKNYDKVKDLNCSEPIKCYYAANLELEYAMTDLVAALENANIADNTVIMLATDHYPYGLDKSETWGTDADYLAELYGYSATDTAKRDHSALIIWSGCIEDKNITVDTPVYSLDIVPTLSNLFGTEYDSRLLVGRDVFSDQTPLVLWPNYSWKTDKGYYNSSTKKFTPSNGETVDDEYIKNISSIVKNKIKYSKYVLENDYYNTLFKG